MPTFTIFSSHDPPYIHKFMSLLRAEQDWKNIQFVKQLDFTVTERTTAC